MRVSNYHADFPASNIAKRFADSLMGLPVDTLLNLTDMKMLVIPQSQQYPYRTLSYRNLRWEYLDDYALACNEPLSNFIFGEQIPSGMDYSYFDVEAAALLNTVSTDVLKSARYYIRQYFFNERMRIPRIAPSRKIISLAILHRRTLKLVKEDEIKKYTTNINEALLYYGKARIKERCMLNIDYISDLCAYFKVSPHWAFSLRGPLFFTTSEADLFFDDLCFLSREQQSIALGVLLALYPEAEGILNPDMIQRLRLAVSSGGGVVL